jgi:tetratricopeptide (TPR) repeat protein
MPVFSLIALLCFVFCAGCTDEPTSLRDQWNDKGNSLADQGRYEEALDAFNTALTYDSGDALTYVYRGIVLHDLNRVDEAMKDFDFALTLNPHEGRAWIGIATIYIDAGDYLRAEQAVDRVIEEANQNSDKVIVDAYLIRGFAHNRLQQYESALRYFDLAITLDPERKDLWEHKAYSLVSMGRLTEALQCYDYLIQLYPDDPQLWNTKGSVHMALGQTTDANRAYATAKSIMLNSR